MPLNISSNTKGILFIIAAVSCLSVMDGVTRYLTDYYNVIAINMFRYFFLFLFVISINSTGNKSVILVSKSKFKLIQILNPFPFFAGRICNYRIFPDLNSV